MSARKSPATTPSEKAPPSADSGPAPIDIITMNLGQAHATLDFIMTFHDGLENLCVQSLTMACHGAMECIERAEEAANALDASDTKAREFITKARAIAEDAS